MTRSGSTEHGSPAAVTPPATARGYTLVLPPGWTRIPLRTGTDDAIAAIVERRCQGSPPEEAAGIRTDLAQHLRGLAEAAQDQCGLDLYLPTEHVHGYALPASFVVAEVAFGSVQPIEPARQLARLLAESATAPARLGGVIAARSERAHPAYPERGIPAPSRRVEYVAPVPGHPDRWLVVTFSTLDVPPSPATDATDATDAAEEDLTGLLTELFDAIMTTFRWTALAA